MFKKYILSSVSAALLALHVYAVDKDQNKSNIDGDNVGVSSNSATSSPQSTTPPATQTNAIAGKTETPEVLDNKPILAIAQIIPGTQTKITEQKLKDKSGKEVMLVDTAVVYGGDSCAMALAPTVCVAKAEYINAVITKYKYDSAKINHRQKVFEWQHFSSVFMFWVVMAIVLTGLVLASFQFYTGYKSSKKMKDTGSKEQTEINLTLSGVQIKSSLIGLLVFITSLAFLFMYLKFVYPIEKI